MPQQSKDFVAKSKRREFREKLQVRSDRKKARQEEREKQEQRALGEGAGRGAGRGVGRREQQSKYKSSGQTSQSLGLGDEDESPVSPISRGVESVGLRSEATSFSSRPVLRSGTTVSGFSMASPDDSDGLPDSDDEGAERRRKPMSRQTTRSQKSPKNKEKLKMSLRGRSASGVLDESKKGHKGSLSGVLSGGLRSTGKTLLKTGTTIGLLLGVVPSKTSRRKASKSWNSMDNAGENVKARAREAVGYPENPEDSGSETKESEGIRRFPKVWVTGVLVVWILEPLGYEIDLLRRLAALRVLRLGRLARAVRIMPMFHEWQEHDLQVAQKTQEERMQEMKELRDAKAEVKKDEKILPAKLPAVLAPRKMKQEVAQGSQKRATRATTIQVEETVKKDVNKMNIKELKAGSDR
eukprot:Skav205628  [mRNA]  locus=scaffold1575:79735:97947:+ [translate_table: standard]